LCRPLQKCQQVGALSSIFDAGKGHLIVGYDMLRVIDPLVERLVVPNDARGLKGG
jgi:hypothetical protein